MVEFLLWRKSLIYFASNLYCFLQEFAECSIIGVEERSGEVTAFNPPWQLQSFPELFCLAPLERFKLFIGVDLLDDLEVFVFDSPEIVFLRERFPGVLKLVDEGVFYLADVENKILLLFTSFFQPRRNTKQLYWTALNVTFAALFAWKIIAYERYFLTMWVDAHSFYGFRTVALDSHWLVKVVETKYGLKIGILESSFLHLHYTNIKITDNFVLLLDLLIFSIAL